MKDCKVQLRSNFIFQQDGAPAHAAQQTQDFLQRYTPDFIIKDEWPPNSPDLNPLDYYVWGDMLERYNSLSPKPTDVEQLKQVLQTMGLNFPRLPFRRQYARFDNGCSDALELRVGI